jgi:hypothetical protein
MNKQREMNYELIRVRLIGVYEEYTQQPTRAAALTKMKEVVKEYDDVIEMLEETLNCAISIMDAIIKGEIKDKKEEETVVNDILKELKSKDYLCIGGEKEDKE